MSSIGLYVHFPWCVKKCPYCDFNSHSINGKIPEHEYVSCLVNDLCEEASNFDGNVNSIFLGGGTPSLFSAQSIGKILSSAKTLLTLSDDIEITLEANPGTLDVANISGFREKGVNRLSLGVQSFKDRSLVALGRAHNRQDVKSAISAIKSAGFRNINFDLMHGLPQQDWKSAKDDLEEAISHEPTHISWYQLTIEPNTLFSQNPPSLPSEEILVEIYERGIELLAKAGFFRYEISAFSRQGKESQHNLNYWQFGDYIGIGAGAHGKYTYKGNIYRTTKTRSPKDYLSSPNKKTKEVSDSDKPIEYLMNSLRLVSGSRLHDFEERTGCSKEVINTFLEKAYAHGFIDSKERLVPTTRGLRFVDEVLLLLD